MALSLQTDAVAQAEIEGYQMRLKQAALEAMMGDCTSSDFTAVHKDTAVLGGDHHATQTMGIHMTVQVATGFAIMKETDYMNKPKFLSNFWAGFSKVLGPGHVIKDLGKCDFTPIYDHLMAEREAKKGLAKEVSGGPVSSAHCCQLASMPLGARLDQGHSGRCGGIC